MGRTWRDRRLGRRGRGVGPGGGATSVAPPVLVADADAEMGALTLEGAGAYVVGRTGGVPSNPVIASGDASSHFAIAIVSGQIHITPTAAGVSAGLSGSPYTLSVEADDSEGNTVDAVNIVMTAVASAYSARTTTEAKAAAAAISTGGGVSILLRSGSYAEDADFLKNRAFTSAVTVTPHTGATATFSKISVNNSDNVTLDGLTFFRATAGVLVDIIAGSDTVVVQNSDFSGPTIDPEGDYSAAQPTNVSGIGRDGTTAPVDVSILNNTFTNIYLPVNMSCTGALRIEGNDCQDFYSDALKLAFVSGQTSVKLFDNVLEGIIGSSDDADNPHPDFIQFIGGTGADWEGIEIYRNRLIDKYSRGGGQGIFLEGMDTGFYYSGAKINGNVIATKGGSTTGIRVREAKAIECYGNTVVSNLLFSAAGPGIVIGDRSTSGTHIVKNNAADAFSIAGTSDTDNNHTLGIGGATIAYTTAFAGADFVVESITDLLTEFAMKASGPLDADTSGNASVGDAGAIGSGYVTWATTIPGNDGTLDADYEAAAYAAVAVDYDGTNDAVAMSSGFGFLGSKVGLISAWHYWDTATWPGSLRILSLANAGGNERLWLLTATTGRMQINGKNAANSTILTVTTGDNAYAAETWHHTLIAWDIENSLFDWYVDDVSLGLTPGTITDDTIEACTRAGVGNVVAGTPAWDGGFSDLFFHPSYLDLSVEANRRKFISATGKPVDLDTDGSIPLSTQPLLFMSGAVASWHTNKGTGGGLTETGELTEFASSPSD